MQHPRGSRHRLAFRFLFGFPVGFPVGFPGSLLAFA
jgi:hypothetical protein